MRRKRFSATKKIQQIEDDLTHQYNKEEIPPNDIVAYNELRSCADLYRMYDNKILQIQPEYQREIIWKDPDQTRFIDSLMKQLPIPSMCFSLDNSTQQWKVVDGLQRMSTIIRFFHDKEWVLSRLNDVDKRICGKRPIEIQATNEDLYRRVQNITLPITVLRVDYKKKNHTEYMFMIFRRLNEQGYVLNNQEIRNAIFQGPFNTFLKECDKKETWRKIMGVLGNKTDRFRRVELILRLFAFYDRLNSYTGKLAPFLNDYMYINRRADNDAIQQKQHLFNKIIHLIDKGTDIDRPLHRLSRTVTEAILYGVATNINTLNRKTGNSFIDIRLERMMRTESFSDENIWEGIAKKEKVKERLITAKNLFSK